MTTFTKNYCKIPGLWLYVRRGSSLSAKRKEHKYDFICTGTATGGHKSDFICSKRKTKKSLFGNLPTDTVQDMTSRVKDGKPKCFTLSFSIDEILSWYLGYIVTCWMLVLMYSYQAKVKMQQVAMDDMYIVQMYGRCYIGFVMWYY